MNVSPLQQLPTVDAPLIGSTKPLNAASPLADGAFSAWLASSTSEMGTEIAKFASNIPLVGGIAGSILPEVAVSIEGAELPVNTSGILASATTFENPAATAKQETVLASVTQLATKAGFTSLQIGARQEGVSIEGNGSTAKPLPGNLASETQPAQLNPARLAQGLNTASAANTLTANQANLPNANAAQFPVDPQAAQTQSQNNAKQSIPNGSLVASTTIGMDSVAQQAETTVQSNTANTTNTNSTLPIPNAAARPMQAAKTTGEGNPAARGSLNTSINTADIAVQMARHKADGSNQFTIRLSPESMGTVTIRLNIGNNSQLSAQMQVEKPETLALLQKDLAGLEKALKAQGFNTSSSDISIALKSATTVMRMGDVMGENIGDQRPGQGQSASQNQQSAQSSQSNSTSTPQSTNAQTANNQAPQSGTADRSAPGSTLPSGSDTGGFQQSSQGRGDQSQMASDQGFQGHPDDVEADELEASNQGLHEIIANAYQASNILVGMSSQVDLSI